MMQLFDTEDKVITIHNISLDIFYQIINVFFFINTSKDIKILNFIYIFPRYWTQM